MLCNLAFVRVIHDAVFGRARCSARSSRFGSLLFDLFFLHIGRLTAAMATAVSPPGDTLSFPTNHKLLNARFESYKLAALPRGDDAVISTPLPKPFVLPETAAHARLSYQQVADRARHNHLKAGPDGELVYIDGTGFVTAVEVDPAVSRHS